MSEIWDGFDEDYLRELAQDWSDVHSQQGVSMYDDEFDHTQLVSYLDAYVADVDHDERMEYLEEYLTEYYDYPEDDAFWEAYERA